MTLPDGSHNHRAFHWYKDERKNYTLVDPDVVRVLTEDAQEQIAAWDGEESCHCMTTNPPCSYCSDPKSPANIQEQDDSWEWRCRFCGGHFDEQPFNGRCDYDDCSKWHLSNVSKEN